MGDPKEDPNAKLLEELRTKHDAIAHFVDPKTSQLFAFRTPSLVEWERFEERTARGKDALGPLKRELCLSALVYPEGDAGVQQLRSVFERYPRSSTLIGDELVDLVSGDIEVTTKKD